MTTQLYGNPNDHSITNVERTDWEASYTPYAQWKDRASLKTAFIINNACNDEWIMVELDTRADVNYNNRLQRCRWYISKNECTDNRNTMMMYERFPETDEMICEQITELVSGWSHPNIWYVDKELIKMSIHHLPIEKWSVDTESMMGLFRDNEDDDPRVELFYDLPHSKITNCTDENGTQLHDLVIFEETLRRRIPPVRDEIRNRGFRMETNENMPPILEI